MQRALALMLVVSLAVSGCASARGSAPQPAVSPDPAITALVTSLPPGSRMRVEMTGGRSVRGTLIQATSDTLTLQRHTRIPEPPISVPVADVLRVTLDTPSIGNRAVAIGAAIGAGAAIGVLWLIFALAVND